MRREHCANAVAAAALLAVGAICNGSMLLVAGGIAVNLVSVLTENGAASIGRRVLRRPGELNHDLQAALERAFDKALVDVERGWWRTNAGNHARLQDRGAEGRIRGLFEALRRDSRAALEERSLTQFTDTEVMELARDEEKAQQELSRQVAAWFREVARTEVYADELVRYVSANLARHVALRFGEELKEDKPENNRAWRAFQWLMAETLQQSVDRVQAGTDNLSRRVPSLPESMRYSGYE